MILTIVEQGEHTLVELLMRGGALIRNAQDPVDLITFSAMQGDFSATHYFLTVFLSLDVLLTYLDSSPL